MKDTPLKIVSKVNKIDKDTNKSMDYSVNSEKDNDSENDDDLENDDDKSDSETNISSEVNKTNETIESTDDDKPFNSKEKCTTRVIKHEFANRDTKMTDVNNDDDDFESNDEKSDDDDGANEGDSDNDDGPDEDLMVMSRATRMSIMGVIPKDDESDDSDYIQSDEVT